VDRESVVAANTSLKSSLGISNEPALGKVRIGVDSTGKPMFADQTKVDSSDPSSGTDYVRAFAELINPFGVLDDKDKSYLDTVKDVAGDTAFIGTLTQAAQNKDAKQFVELLVGKYGKKAARKILGSKQDQAAVNASVNGYFLYNNWNNLSEAQKLIGVANIGIQASEALTGNNLSKKVVPGSESYFDGKGVTVGQALGMMSAGYNGYSLAKNWKQLDALQRITAGAGTLSQAAALGKSLGLLGTGSNSAVVTTTADDLAALGATPAPAMGVGAVVVAPDGAVPAGYTAVSTAKDGSTVAVPQGLESTSAVPAVVAGAGAAASIANTAANYSEMRDEERALAVSQAATQTGQAAVAAGVIGPVTGLSQAAGAVGIAGGAYTIYKAWGTGGKKGALHGALGGASMAAGLSALGASNPYLLAGTVAFGATAGTIKKGKHEDQSKRDTVRRALKDNGFVSPNYSIELADGTRANIGIDGDGGKRLYKNTGKKVSKDDREELYAYDTDYTNDLDFFAGMGGMALSRILTGSNTTEAKQVGSQLGNASLGKVGFGADLTPENFKTVMQNQRSLYAKAGVNNKEDAYQLANVMYAEGRIDDTDLVGMHQAFNMVFDDDFNTANTLAAGRYKGIELAAEVAPGTEA
jgi:hypothetical protein